MKKIAKKKAVALRNQQPLASRSGWLLWSRGSTRRRRNISLRVATNSAPLGVACKVYENETMVKRSTMIMRTQVGCPSLSAAGFGLSSRNPKMYVTVKNEKFCNRVTWLNDEGVYDDKVAKEIMLEAFEDIAEGIRQTFGIK